MITTRPCRNHHDWSKSCRVWPPIHMHARTHTETLRILGIKMGFAKNAKPPISWVWARRAHRKKRDTAMAKNNKLSIDPMILCDALCSLPNPEERYLVRGSKMGYRWHPGSVPL